MNTLSRNVVDQFQSADEHMERQCIVLAMLLATKNIFLVKKSTSSSGNKRVGRLCSYSVVLNTTAVSYETYQDHAELHRQVKPERNSIV